MPPSDQDLAQLHDEIAAWMASKRPVGKGPGSNLYVKGGGRDPIVGAGLWDRVKKFGSKAVGYLKDRLGSAAKTTFQALANAYRAASGNPNVRQLLPGELNFGLHNFTGPGTRVDIPAIAAAKPYNDIDAASKVHDLDYMAAKNEPDPVKRAALIHEADRKAIIGYQRYPNENGYSAALAGIAGKFGLEQALSAIKGKASVLYGGSAAVSSHPFGRRRR